MIAHTKEGREGLSLTMIPMPLYKFISSRSHVTRLLRYGTLPVLLCVVSVGAIVAHTALQAHCHFLFSVACFLLRGGGG